MQSILVMHWPLTCHDRDFKMGKLFDLIMLDTRNYDRSITDLSKYI